MPVENSDKIYKYCYSEYFVIVTALWSWLTQNSTFFYDPKQSYCLVLNNGAAGFGWTWISISGGFLKSRSLWKILLWATACWNQPLASFLQGRKGSILFICPCLLFAFPPFSSFFFMKQVQSGRKMNCTISVMTYYHYNLLFYMFIPLTNMYQTCISDTLSSTRQSKSNRHRNEKSSCILQHGQRQWKVCTHSALGPQAVLKIETTKQQKPNGKELNIFVSFCIIDIVGTQLLNPAKLSLL